MTIKTLTALSDEDLEQLGVDNPPLRQRMIKNFSQQNRIMHTFDK